MRILVMFDLPVIKKKDRQDATRFRNFLLKDGYTMLQFSIYARICSGLDSVQTHKNRLKLNIPESGAIRVLTLTEKQFENMDLMLGPLCAADRPQQIKMPLVF